MDHHVGGSPLAGPAMCDLSFQACHPCETTVQAKGSSGSDGDEVAAKQPRRFTESGSGSASR